MAKKLIVGIDITDWQDECLQEEVAPMSEDDLVFLVTEQGYSTAQAGRFGVVQEEVGNMPEGIMMSRKLQLQYGARYNVTSLVSSRMREVEMPNGKVIEAREWIGIPGRKPNDGNAVNEEDVEAMGKRPFVQSGSEQALNRAIHYLEEIVPGHIQRRFVDVVAAGGDVEAAAKGLHDKIDELVEGMVS